VFLRYDMPNTNTQWIFYVATATVPAVAKGKIYPLMSIVHSLIRVYNKYAIINIIMLQAH
jgi:hypothetical protein